MINLTIPILQKNKNSKKVEVPAEILSPEEL
jgi:hypothetical protein